MYFTKIIDLRIPRFTFSNRVADSGADFAGLLSLKNILWLVRYPCSLTVVIAE